MRQNLHEHRHKSIICRCALHIIHDARYQETRGINVMYSVNLLTESRLSVRHDFNIAGKKRKE